MAYFSQEQKKAIAPTVKTILNKYGLKGSLSVHHNSKVVLAIKEGKLFEKFDDSHVDVNVYHFKTSEKYNETEKEFLKEVYDVLNTGNHDDSDITTDYFNVGWYVDITVGKWDKKYKHVA